MQIGGCVMDSDGMSEEEPQSSPTEMTVIVKRESIEPSPSTSTPETSPESDQFQSPIIWPFSKEIKQENDDIVGKVDEPKAVSVIQKHESKNIIGCEKSDENIVSIVSGAQREKILENGLAKNCEKITSTAILSGKVSYESLPNESIKSWLQRITAMQNEIQKTQTVDGVQYTTAPPPMVAPRSNDNKRKILPSPTVVLPPGPPPPSRVVNYCDLPYMGEMTLDNCKPRRGRKPKKADICHLIYKNYGTIIPGNPAQNVTKPRVEPTADVDSPKTDPASPILRSDIQNKIISSLLEKRLTLETRKKEEIVAKNSQNEPLNLCIRDLNQLKIRLLRRHDNVYESTSPVEIKSEPHSDDEVEFVDEIKVAAKNSEPTSPENSEKNSASSEADAVPGGYVFWPNAGVFVHPMALQSQMLYYQKLAANNNYVLPSPGSRPSSNASSTSSTILKKSEEAGEKVKRGSQTPSTASSSAAPPPTKRKRSAIFIPPIPSENQTNPATEVSICKFKFTGGAKPSLQEKKMLSVDSGGNFRYYSGTGDKSMRGYEFFPRETLQQQQANTQNSSSSGVFLNASGEKLPLPPHLVENSPAMRPHFLLTPEPVPPPSPTSSESLAHKHKKRKTRKSIQREKLEQTFKEKGFLIQTQQLESAEGATYCKFRQLRKFTRYLFRSWKDYLPGNVRDMQAEGLPPNAIENLEHLGDKSDDEFENLPSSSNQGPILDEVISNDSSV